MKFRIEISVFLYLLFLTINSAYVFSKQMDTEQLIKYVSSYNYEAIKEMGPEVIPVLTDLYSVSDVKQKRVIANT